MYNSNVLRATMSIGDSAKGSETQSLEILQSSVTLRFMVDTPSQMLLLKISIMGQRIKKTILVLLVLLLLLVSMSVKPLLCG